MITQNSYIYIYREREREQVKLMIRACGSTLRSCNQTCSNCSHQHHRKAPQPQWSHTFVFLYIYVLNYHLSQKLKSSVSSKSLLIGDAKHIEYLIEIEGKWRRQLEFRTCIYHAKLKLIGIGKFNHLINTLTINLFLYIYNI
jgi:hypothetical protein